LWDAGYEVWSRPAATVRHKFSATMGEGTNLRRKYYRNTRNRLRLILRNFPASSAWRVIPGYLHAEVKALGRALLDGEPWRAWSHVRSWFAGLAYIPKAVAARQAARNRGLRIGSYWPMVRKDCLYFHGVELPVDGWYQSREFEGQTFLPMARVATQETAGGTLRVTHANCYPQLGDTDIEVYAGDEHLVTLQTSHIDAVEVTVPPGRLRFVAKHLFRAEDTGAHEDFGGWLRTEEVQERDTGL
jgi:hypothetical protein